MAEPQLLHGAEPQLLNGDEDREDADASESAKKKRRKKKRKKTPGAAGRTHHFLGGKRWDMGEIYIQRKNIL